MEYAVVLFVCVIFPHLPNCAPSFKSGLPKVMLFEPTRLKFCNPSSERKFVVAFKFNFPSTVCKAIKLEICLMLSAKTVKSRPMWNKFRKHPISRTSKLLVALIKNDPPTLSSDGNAVDSIRCTPAWIPKFCPTFSRFVIEFWILNEDEEDRVSM